MILIPLLRSSPLLDPVAAISLCHRRVRFFEGELWTLHRVHLGGKWRVTPIFAKVHHYKNWQEPIILLKVLLGGLWWCFRGYNFAKTLKNGSKYAVLRFVSFVCVFLLKTINQISGTNTKKRKCISYPKKTKRVSSPSNNEATFMASTSSFCPFDFVGSFSGSPCSMESWEWSHRWERQRRASWLLWHQRSQRSPKRSCNQTKFKLLDSNAVENIF